MRSACCALPSDRQPKLQPPIATFSAGEFRRQPALSDNTVVMFSCNPEFHIHCTAKLMSLDH